MGTGRKIVGTVTLSAPFYLSAGGPCPRRRTVLAGRLSGSNTLPENIDRIRAAGPIACATTSVVLGSVLDRREAKFYRLATCPLIERETPTVTFGMRHNDDGRRINSASIRCEQAGRGAGGRAGGTGGAQDEIWLCRNRGSKGLWRVTGASCIAHALLLPLPVNAKPENGPGVGPTLSDARARLTTKGSV